MQTSTVWFCLHKLPACMPEKSLQLYLTFCDPMDCSLPGSSVRGILQARILEWSDTPCSWGPSQPRDQTSDSYISCIGIPSKLFQLSQLFVTLWTVACQAPLSMGFSRQEYWSGLPCSPLGGFPNPGIEPTPLTSCIGRQILYYQSHLGSPYMVPRIVNFVESEGTLVDAKHWG